MDLTWRSGRSLASEAATTERRSRRPLARRLLAALLAGLLTVSPVLAAMEYTGTVTITTAVTDPTVSIGSTTDTATAAVTVTDGGSIVAGNNGDATANGVYIGNYAGSTGNALVVEGTGTLTTDSLVIGRLSDGNSFTARSGATVVLKQGTNDLFTMGTDGNSLTVTGAGTTLTGGKLRMDGSGNSVTIADGAVVGTVTLMTIGGLDAGATPNTVLVTGTGTSLNPSTAVRLVIGGTTGLPAGGSFTVADGAVAKLEGTYDSTCYVAAICLAPVAARTAKVTVTGAGSTLSMRIGRVFVGDNGRASMEVLAGATFSQPQLVAYPFHVGRNVGAAGSSLLVDGAGTTLTGGQLMVGQVSTGNTVTVSRGATAAVAAAQVGSGNTASSNSVTVDGVGSMLSVVLANASGSTVVGSALNSGNRIAVRNGGSLATGDVLMLHRGSSIETDGGGFIGQTATTPSLLVEHPTSATGASTARINGTLRVAGAAGLTVGGYGTLAGSGTVIAPTTTIEAGGTLGPGATSTSPYTAPGLLSFVGDLAWKPGGAYNWQTKGTTDTVGAAPGTTWDVVSVTGTLDLSALSAGAPFSINLWSLTSAATTTSGVTPDLDNTRDYRWLIATADRIIGFDPAAFTIALGATNGTGGFQNVLDIGGVWAVRQDGDRLFLTYEVADASWPSPDPEPQLGSVTPSSGPEAGGTTITLDGSGFSAGATVSVEGTACGNAVVVDAETITCDVPAGSGTASVTVTNPDLQLVTKSAAFAYVAPTPSPSPTPSSSPTPTPTPSPEPSPSPTPTPTPSAEPSPSPTPTPTPSPEPSSSPTPSPSPSPSSSPSPTPSPVPSPSPTPSPSATPSPTPSPSPAPSLYASRGFLRLAPPPALNSVKARSTRVLRFRVTSGTTIVSDPAVVRSLTTEPSCFAGASLPARLLVPAAGPRSLRWSARRRLFTVRWRAPSAPGATVTAVVTLIDGTRIAACFRSR